MLSKPMIYSTQQVGVHSDMLLSKKSDIASILPLTITRICFDLNIHLQCTFEQMTLFVNEVFTISASFVISQITVKASLKQK